MIAFNFDKQKVLEVLDYFKKYYDLDEISCQELEKNFNEYSKMYETNLQNSTETIEQQDLDKSIISKNSNYESFITQNEASENKEEGNDNKNDFNFSDNNSKSNEINKKKDNDRLLINKSISEKENDKDITNKLENSWNQSAFEKEKKLQIKDDAPEKNIIKISLENPRRKNDENN